MPANCLVKVVKGQNHKVSYQRARPESQNTPKGVLRANWQREQMGTGRPDAPCSITNQMGAGRPGATSLAFVPRVDTRSQGVHQTETDQDDRQKLIANLLRAILSDADRDELIQELQESRRNEYTPSSEEEKKKKIHSQGNTECFDLCVLLEKEQCAHCLRCSAPGHLYCRCGTLFTKEHAGSEGGKKFRPQPAVV